MHVDWNDFVGFLSNSERGPAVRRAWKKYMRPYDEPERAEPGRDDRHAAWLTRHGIAGRLASGVVARVDDLVIVLPAHLEAVVEGRLTTIVLDQCAGSFTDRPLAVLSALLVHSGGDRRLAVLDESRDELRPIAPGPETDELLRREVADFVASWRRLDRLFRRMDIYAYLPPGTDIPAWDLSRFSWEGVRDITDVGCGTGRHIRKLPAGLRVTGIDPSAGALRRAAADTRGQDVRYVVGGLPGLPVADDSADVVLAMHMLYNVDDIDAGLADIRRTLRPGGRLLATVSGAGHLAEIDELFAAAVRTLHGDWPQAVDARPRQCRFDLDIGQETLRRHFAEVRRDDLVLPLRYVDGEPVVRYLDTMRPWREAHLPDGLAWDTVMGEVGRRVRDRIQRDGVLSATLHEGALICR